jgi:hypothetical protein
MGYLLRNGMLKPGWEDDGPVQAPAGMGHLLRNGSLTKDWGKEGPIQTPMGMGHLQMTMEGAALLPIWWEQQVSLRRSVGGTEGPPPPSEAPSSADQAALDESVRHYIEINSCDCRVSSGAFMDTNLAGIAQWCQYLCCETGGSSTPCNCGEVKVCVTDHGSHISTSGTASSEWAFAPLAGGPFLIEGGVIFTPAVAVGIALAVGVVVWWAYEESKRTWTCSASCNIQVINPRIAPNPPDRVTGIASGSSESEACEAAKRMATQSAPIGTYARHCQCDCSNE